MADEQYEAFVVDLKRYANMLSFLQASSDFISLPPLEIAQEDEERTPLFITKANMLNEAVRQAHSGLPMMRGSVLFLAVARFEAFVRAQIEDLALRASQNAGSFARLPREMKQNLQKYSATVLAEPKKFRVEKYVQQIASTLAKNLTGTSGPGEINHHCISITFENMRAETISELFLRLGISDFWERVGGSPEMQRFFETHESERAKSKSTSTLNYIVDMRNRIAHAPQSITWPSHDNVANYIGFFSSLGNVISSLLPIYEIQLKASAPPLPKEQDTGDPAA